jgi:hypothetical protein
MEQTPQRRRPPRQKLKMPFFGDLMGGSGNSSAGQEKISNGKITPLIFLVVLVVYGIDYLTSSGKNSLLQELAILNRWLGMVKLPKNCQRN